MKVIKHKGTLVSLDMSEKYNANGLTCIQGIEKKTGEPWATFTKCISDMPLQGNYTVLDTNNYPEILGILVDAGIVKDSGYKAHSGWCSYPVVKLLEQE
jgi:hypothetical protein